MTTARQLDGSYVREFHAFIEKHDSADHAFSSMVSILKMSRMVSTSAVIENASSVHSVLRHLNIVSGLPSPDSDAFDDGTSSIDTSIAEQVISVPQTPIESGQPYPATFTEAAAEYFKTFSDKDSAISISMEGLELANRAGAFELILHLKNPEFGMLGELPAHLRNVA